MSVSRRLGAVLRLSSGLLAFLALAWIASAIATGPANHHLLNARAAHTATAQVDGSLLIAGGTGTGNRGAIKTLEFFDPVTGKSSPGPHLIEARSGHSAIALADGRVLLTGGRNGDSALLASSEIYDAGGGSLNPGASMGHARANHTSTLLADGRVLLAGGDAEGMAEIYDPATNRFVDAGKLAVARSGHSSVRLGDGRVLLIGGYNAAGATAEIFDPKTNTSSAVRGGLKTARVQPTLKLISDGKVQVYGGDAEITMEVYNPAGYFSSRGHLLRDSSAFRSVMYSPGQAALITIPSGKAKHYAEDALGPAADEFERTGHTATEVAARSTMVVVGGFGTTGAALDTVTELGSCSGTVTSDLTDYVPGETVIMSGSGWAPGEQITLNLHRDTNDPPDTILYATADENGEWINAEYVVQEFDANITFVLTASGDSGCSAQTTFTDSVTSVTITSPTTGTPFTVSTLPTTMNVTFSYVASATGPTTVTIDVLGSGGVSVGPTTIPDGSGTQTIAVNLPAGLGTGNHNLKVTVENDFSNTSKQASQVQNNAVVVGTVQATTTTLTSSLNASTYGNSVTFTATVHAGVPLVTTGSVNFIDGGTCASPTVTLASGVALNGSGQATYTSSNLIPPTPVLSAGSHLISACYNGTTSFAASSASLTQIVNNAQLTVTADNKSRAYGAADPTFTYTIGGFVNGENSGVVSGAASCSTTAVATSGVGPYPINCTQGNLSAANYTFAFVAGTLTITPAELTVTAANKSRAYGAADPTFTYTIGGFVNGENSGVVSGAASCSTTAVATSGVGPYPINCTQGNLSAANYTFAFVAGTLTITPAELTVTAANKSRAYGAADPTFTYTIGGFVNGENSGVVSGAASCSTTAVATSGVGPYPINCTQGNLSAANYTFAFVAGTLTITPAELTVTAANKSRAYGAADPTFTYTIGGFVNGENSGVVSGAASCSTTAVATSGVGPYPINCTQGNLSAANYTFAFVAGTLTITPAELTVTAANKSRAYGAADPTFTYTIGGFVNGENSGVVSGAASCSTTAVATSGVGPYPINCTQGNLSAANYTFAFVAGTLTITPAELTVTAANKSRAYGAADPTFTYTIGGFVNGENSGVVSGAASCSTTAVATSGVGPYPINCTQGNLSAANYTFAFVAGTLTITPAELTVTAANKSRAYGAADPTFTYTIGGFVNGENSGVVSGAASCSTTAVATSGVGPYPINCTQGNLSAANYTFAFVAGTLTITPAELTVTAANKSRAYGAADPTFTYTIGGFVNGENSGVVSGAASCSTTAVATSGVGPYPINCTQGNLSAANYTFAFVAGTLTITPAQLTVTADNKNKIYGSPNPTLTYTIMGFVNGENSGVVSGVANCSTVPASSGVGAYAITCTKGTLSAANYTFAFVAGTLTINPAQLTVTAQNKSKIYGSPTPALTYVITGFVNGDPSSVVSGTASCSTAPPGSGVGTYPITCAVGLLTATNYTFTFVDGTLTITPALLTVTATSTSKHFGDMNPAFAYTFSGFVNGDTPMMAVTGTASCTSPALQFTPISPPTYPITCTIGTLAAANYTFTFVGGTLTITARSALVNYIGQQTFVTSGSSSTTAQVTLSASVQDPTGLGLSGAKVDFIDATPGGTGKALATGVPVSPVQNALFTGTANVIVTLSTGQYGSQSYQILVQMTGDYDNKLQPLVDKTATVVVVQPPAAYQTTGGGTLPGLSRAGAYAGNGASFSVGLSYTSKLTNLKGQISLTIPQADGTVYVKSNSLSSMAVTGTGDSEGATIYAKSNMIKVINGTTVTIDGNVTLRMDVTEGKPGNPGSVGFTVLSSKDSSLYYSNNWQSVPPTTPPGGQNVWKTVLETFTGTVMISD